MALGIPPHQLWSIAIWDLPLHGPGASLGEGAMVGQSTELVAASPHPSLGMGLLLPHAMGWILGGGGHFSTVSQARPPGSPWASNEPAPHCIPAAPVPAARRTRAAAPGRDEEEEQLQGRAFLPAASMQRVCQASALSQELTKPWTARTPPCFQLLPEPAALRDRRRAPPREEEEATQRQGQQQVAWGCWHIPRSPQCYSPPPPPAARGPHQSPQTSHPKL